MPLIWITSRRGQRLRLPAPDEPGKRRDAPLWLQIKQWAGAPTFQHAPPLGSASAGFEVLCQSLRAQGHDVKEAFVGTASCNLIYGIMSVKVHVVRDGPFGILSAEQRFSWELLGCNKMVFLSAENVIRLAEPQVCVPAQMKKQPQQFFPLHPDLEATLWTMLSSDGVRTIEQAVREAGMVDEEVGRVTAMQLLPAVALALGDMWQDISVAIPPTRPSVHWPPLIRNAQLFEDQFASSALPPVDLANPAVLHELAENLRASAQIMQGQGLAHRDNVKAGLETWIGLLDNQGRHMQRLAQNPGMESSGHGNQRYSIVFLLRCLMVCISLRNVSVLRALLVRAIGTIFPEHTADYFKDVINDKAYTIPTGPVLSQMRYILDAGLMLMQRGATAKHVQATKAPTYYHMFDSSPQGGMNWFMSQYDVIRGEDIMAVGTSMLGLWRISLSRGGGGHRDDDDDDEDAKEKEATFMETLARCIEHHDNIPVGLASGRASLCYEVHAWYHALYMETGSVATLPLAQHNLIFRSGMVQPSPHCEVDETPMGLVVVPSRGRRRRRRTSAAASSVCLVGLHQVWLLETSVGKRLLSGFELWPGSFQ